LSTSGVYNVDTGANSYQMGRILRYNYEDKINSAFGNDCSTGDFGSTGEFFYSPYKKETLNIFVAEMCTTLQLKFDRFDDELGVKGIKYVLDTLQRKERCSQNPNFPELLDIGNFCR
jgi:hypothetical protein